MSRTLGVFLSDVHLPDSINLKPVFSYIGDLYKKAGKDKFVVILGGDIVDADGLHGVESMAAGSFKMEWYHRDVRLLDGFMASVKKAAPKAELVYISGNHENRYERLMDKYPDVFGGQFKLRDVVGNYYSKFTWVPYGNYKSFYKLGDCVFTHGTIYPESHAKKYALNHSPYKVVYGHLHHFQSFTLHNAMPNLPPRYSVTAGCLCHLAPEWKRGYPHAWINGFCSFVSENGVTTPTPHVIEKGKFTIGGVTYQ